MHSIDDSDEEVGCMVNLLSMNAANALRALFGFNPTSISSVGEIEVACLICMAAMFDTFGYPF